ncbi:MAG: hypothetical protein Greene071421_167 [Parcubacteria group bacterium Greene0714_21]|nr:MAG: hypothetical protein Greene041639_185 [Parcubacteria group bacterium Greene0416_39]TSC98570.1 MAG: hypothetical protein Greene101447_72 [Parcubacteria group bacterium Greene1014_47]TSD04331.1 MAG: hypothetical protein Greene071421_167 [Parcubacteria group bacterium Greene0714_21]
MAYVLGFITADGALIKNKRGAKFIEIQSIDKELFIRSERHYDQIWRLESINQSIRIKIKDTDSRLVLNGCMQIY